MSKTKSELIKELQRIEEDCTVTGKGHFNAANRWRTYSTWLGLPIAVLSAFAGISVIGQESIPAIILSFLVTLLISVRSFLEPENKANSHFNFGNEYNNLKNEIRMYRRVICGKEQEDGQILKMESFSKRRNELNKTAPQVPSWAFNEARKGIDEGEATYCVDKEGKA